MTNPSSSDILPEDLLDYRHRIRHSAAHMMAGAVLALYPDAKLGIGPPTADGFYYDFLLLNAFTPEDLETIEARMLQERDSDLSFDKKDLSRDAARSQFSNQSFKQEIIDDIPEGEPISTYRHGDFEDLCEGPHVASTGAIPALKLLSVAGAYWRGDEHRPMLQRIYGTAFESQDALDEHLARLEEAQQRDHRKLGSELGLFFFDPIAPASPFFLPKGAIIYNLLNQYVRDLYQRYGFEEVITPQIFSTELWKRSGHYDNYQENMFFINLDEREYGVKPMNCPAAALLYASSLRSYRDLPIRYSDFGRLHRYERSGVTHGLTRVRTFAQDDTHIFCTQNQIDSEAQSLINMYMEAYELFSFNDIRIALSLRPEKRVGSDGVWDRAEAALETVLTESKLSYESMPGEGAFYGPKIDFFVQDALGREWQLGTIQLDFSLPERFDLEYVTTEGSRERPVVIHKAMLGSIERFMGVLIEHYGGALPPWLAPIQAVVIPIADRHIDYAMRVREQLAYRGLRIEVDAREDRMNAKIRSAQIQKVPYMLIVGDRESEQETVAVRLRSGQDLGAVPLKQVEETISSAVDSRKPA
jgi:threonyl-tRNA synthetase